MAIEGATAGRSQLIPQLPIFRAARDRGGKCLGIFGGHDEAVELVVNPFTHTADIGSDDGLSRAHCLQNHDRHRFVARRRN